MRDRLIHSGSFFPAAIAGKVCHNYFGIDYDIVWDVLINKVPALDVEVRQILQQESSYFSKEEL